MHKVAYIKFRYLVHVAIQRSHVDKAFESLHRPYPQIAHIHRCRNLSLGDADISVIVGIKILYTVSLEGVVIKINIGIAVVWNNCYSLLRSIVRLFVVATSETPPRISVTLTLKPFANVTGGTTKMKSVASEPVSPIGTGCGQIKFI